MWRRRGTDYEALNLRLGESLYVRPTRVRGFVEGDVTPPLQPSDPLYALPLS